MNKYLLLSLAVLLLFSSCKKNNEAQPTEQSQNNQTIAINGTIYPTVIIGNRTWTSVNYNGFGGLNYNSSTTNDANYGKLYTLDEAKAIALPPGWRLPTKADFVDLMKIANIVVSDSDGGYYLDEGGSKKLRSKNDWSYQNGDNSLGFNALPAGYSFIYAGSGLKFSEKGADTEFWCSTSAPDRLNAGETVKHNFSFELRNVKNNDGTVDDYGYLYDAAYVDKSRNSVRFVKDN
jgi:uncharacterized protein (TIGR02145 family)